MPSAQTPRRYGWRTHEETCCHGRREIYRSIPPCNASAIFPIFSARLQMEVGASFSNLLSPPKRGKAAVSRCGTAPFPSDVSGSNRRRPRLELPRGDADGTAHSLNRYKRAASGRGKEAEIANVGQCSPHRVGGIELAGLPFLLAQKSLKALQLLPMRSVAGLAGAKRASQSHGKPRPFDRTARGTDDAADGQTRWEKSPPRRGASPAILF